MDNEKTCSGFGVEAKPEPAARAFSNRELSCALTSIALRMRADDPEMTKRLDGPRPDYVLLAAARRLIERKEP